MNSQHRKTLEAIFSEPVSRNIAWRRIESLLIAINCERIESRGSRVASKAVHFALISIGLIQVKRPNPIRCVLSANSCNDWRLSHEAYAL